MLKPFTWGQFFVISGCLLALYYVIIGIVFYRKEITNLVKGRRSVAATPSGKLVPVEDNDSRYSGDGDDYYSQGDDQHQIYQQVNDLTDDLGDLFNAAMAEGWDKAQTLQLVARKLSDHRNLAGTVFETSVNNYIVIQADKSGLTRVSAEELRGLWKNG